MLVKCSEPVAGGDISADISSILTEAYATRIARLLQQCSVLLIYLLSIYIYTIDINTGLPD